MVKDLRFVTPESEGISSESILEFIDFFKELRINIHSFMIVRHGNIVAEGYYKPYDKDTKKRLYSCSKSIVSMAIGKMWGEGLVDLHAPLASYFPDIEADPAMAEVTVEDALTMTVPKSLRYCAFPTSADNEGLPPENWSASFFSKDGVIDKPSGRLFRYNSHASSVLSDLVKRVTGKGFLEYLRPELDKIGVSDGIECILSPTGFEWGSSGVLATTRDFAKIGELLLNLGEHNGEQLLPREYMEMAVENHKVTVFDENIKPGSYGYGYHIWREPYGYGMHGMRGQVVYCYPDKDLMVVITSSEPDYSVKYYYAASRIYKKICDTPLPENPEKQAELNNTIADLTVDRSFGAPHSESEAMVSGRRYVLNVNSAGIESFTLDFSEEHGSFIFNMKGEEKRLDFGYGKYLDTLFPDKSFYGKQVNLPSGREFRTLVTGSWVTPDRLFIIADVCDITPGSLGISLEFDGDRVALEMRGSGEGILLDYNVTCSGRTR